MVDGVQFTFVEFMLASLEPSKDCQSDWTIRQLNSGVAESGWVTERGLAKSKVLPNS